MLRKGWKILIQTAFFYVLLQMAINSFRAKGWDFPVYYRTASHLLHGEPIYDFARDGAESFKYPPWVAPFFLPLLLLSEDGASRLWQFFQFGCLVFVLRWMRRHLRHGLTLPLSGVFFYGIFHVNFLAGQIQLPLLAAALWGFSRIQGASPAGLPVVFLSLSAKVFNLFSLIGLPRGTLRTGPVLASALAAAFLSLPALFGYPGANPLTAATACLEAATSRTGNLSGAHQGLPGFFEWLLPHLGTAAPAGVPFLLSLLLGLEVFRNLRKRIHVQSQVFALALALGAALHPLAFSYTFTWTWPLGAFAVEHAFLSAPRSAALRFAATLALVLLLLVSSGLVSDWGLGTSVPGARAFGTLLLGWVLSRERED